jgi:hypothetical protein
MFERPSSAISMRGHLPHSASIQLADYLGKERSEVIRELFLD